MSVLLKLRSPALEQGDSLKEGKTRSDFLFSNFHSGHGEVSRLDWKKYKQGEIMYYGFSTSGSDTETHIYVFYVGIKRPPQEFLGTTLS